MYFGRVISTGIHGMTKKSENEVCLDTSLHKLKETHDQRQQLAERTLRMHEEEESHLPWDEDPSPSKPKANITLSHSFA